ncbi:MAG TPA: hypothetical protein VGM88_31290 [Kofleriaceae bacterium]|jgi:hypothetical protein
MIKPLRVTVIAILLALVSGQARAGTPDLDLFEKLPGWSPGKAEVRKVAEISPGQRYALDPPSLANPSWHTVIAPRAAALADPHFVARVSQRSTELCDIEFHTVTETSAVLTVAENDRTQAFLVQLGEDLTEDDARELATAANSLAATSGWDTLQWIRLSGGGEVVFHYAGGAERMFRRAADVDPAKIRVIGPSVGLRKPDHANDVARR